VNILHRIAGDVTRTGDVAPAKAAVGTGQAAPSLMGTLGNPIPDDARTGWLYTRDGTRLRYGVFGADVNPTQGTVCLFGGRGEFIEKYFETIGDLRQREFAVAMIDWRGQGGSQRLLRNRRKGHVNHFSAYEDDLASFMETVVLPDCPPPYYAFAHSMGANVVLRSLARRTWFSRVVVLCPLVQLMPRAVPWGLVRLLADVLSVIGLAGCYIPLGRGRPLEMGPFAGNKLTSDQKRYERTAEILQTEPSLGVGAPTIGWLAAAFQAMAELRTMRFPRPLKAPVLMLAASQDQIVSAKAISRLAKNVPTAREITLDGARHELLMERDELREQVWAAFDAFVPGAADTAYPLRSASTSS
jgi:lysophospholipase